MKSYQTLYPFDSHYLKLGDHKLHYLDEGPSDGPVLLMCHGNPTWSFYFRALISDLRQTYRIVVPDHMGCGYSDKPQRYAYTLEQHIQNIEVLIKHLDLQQIHLVLHDWGGGIGMGYATRHPDNVASFVVFNTAAFYLPTIPLVLKLARSPLFGEFMLRGLNLFAGMALWFAVTHHERMTAEIRAGYLEPYDSWRNRIAIYRFVQDIPISPTHPTRATIDKIDAKLALLRNRPMLIIWGADDFIFTVKDFLAGWQARFPDAQVQILENAGHYVVEDAHESILPLMKTFLSARHPE